MTDSPHKYYRALDVSKTATAAEIKSAYRDRLADLIFFESLSMACNRPANSAYFLTSPLMMYFAIRIIWTAESPKPRIR